MDKISLRYGENPHPKAEFIPQDKSAIEWNPIQGKALSYNNLLDADSAYGSCMDLHFYLDRPCAVSIIKHSNPCGYASGDDPLETLKDAAGRRSCRCLWLYCLLLLPCRKRASLTFNRTIC